MGAFCYNLQKKSHVYFLHFIHEDDAATFSTKEARLLKVFF